MNEDMQPMMLAAAGKKQRRHLQSTVIQNERDPYYSFNCDLHPCLCFHQAARAHIFLQ